MNKTYKDFKPGDYARVVDCTAKCNGYIGKIEDVFDNGIYFLEEAPCKYRDHLLFQLEPVEEEVCCAGYVFNRIHYADCEYFMDKEKENIDCLVIGCKCREYKKEKKQEKSADEKVKDYLKRATDVGEYIWGGKRMQDEYIVCLTVEIAKMIQREELNE